MYEMINKHLFPFLSMFAHHFDSLWANPSTVKQLAFKRSLSATKLMLRDPQNTQLGWLCYTQHHIMGHPKPSPKTSHTVSLIQDRFQLQDEVKCHNSTLSKVSCTLHATSILYHQNDVQKPVDGTGFQPQHWMDPIGATSTNWSWDKGSEMVFYWCKCISNPCMILTHPQPDLHVLFKLGDIQIYIMHI